jgi:hypothetical protein
LAENFSDEFSSSYFGHFSTQKQQTWNYFCIMDNNLLFSNISKQH